MPKASAKDLAKGYSDPDADLVIVSEDGVKFRVDSAYLRVMSKVIRDMMQAPFTKSKVPKTKGQSVKDNRKNVDEIPLSIAAEKIKPYLDLVFEKVDYAKVPFNQAYGALQVCDLLDSKMVSERLVRKMADRPNFQPWQTFCFATRIQDMDMAQISIAAFSTDADLNGDVVVNKAPDTDNLNQWKAAAALTRKRWSTECEAKWFMALIRCAILEDDKPVLRHGYWKRVSKAFPERTAQVG